MAALRAATGDVLELKEDSAQVRAAREVAEARRLAARQALREAGPMQAGAADTVAAAQAVLASLDAEWAQVEAILGPEELASNARVRWLHYRTINEGTLSIDTTHSR